MEKSNLSENDKFLIILNKIVDDMKEISLLHQKSNLNIVIPKSTDWKNGKLTHIYRIESQKLFKKECLMSIRIDSEEFHEVRYEHLIEENKKYSEIELWGKPQSTTAPIITKLDFLIFDQILPEKIDFRKYIEEINSKFTLVKGPEVKIKFAPSKKDEQYEILQEKSTYPLTF
jgi:hypothetical protein